VSVVVIIVMINVDSDGQWGSAVCAFNLTDINRVFDEGNFLERPSLESAWSRVPTASVPNPRPGQVSFTCRRSSNCS